jgi:hypothetical protein
VGDLRARPLQLRVHDRGHEGDRLALQGRRHLHQPLDGLRLCYCRHCAQNFRAATGKELPRLATPEASTGERGYLLWRQQRVFDLWQLWDAETRRINPDACVIPNTGGGRTSRLDMKRSASAPR